MTTAWSTGATVAVQRLRCSGCGTSLFRKGLTANLLREGLIENHDDGVVSGRFKALFLGTGKEGGSGI